MDFGAGLLGTAAAAFDLAVVEVGRVVLLEDFAFGHGGGCPAGGLEMGEKDRESFEMRSMCEEVGESLKLRVEVWMNVAGKLSVKAIAA